jgi:hypothetical protein
MLYIGMVQFWKVKKMLYKMIIVRCNKIEVSHSTHHEDYCISGCYVLEVLPRRSINF